MEQFLGFLRKSWKNEGFELGHDAFLARIKHMARCSGAVSLERKQFKDERCNLFRGSGGIEKEK